MGTWGINHVKVATKLRALDIIDDVVIMDVSRKEQSMFLSYMASNTQRILILCLKMMK